MDCCLPIAATPFELSVIVFADLLGKLFFGLFAAAYVKHLGLAGSMVGSCPLDAAYKYYKVLLCKPYSHSTEQWHLDSE